MAIRSRRVDHADRVDAPYREGSGTGHIMQRSGRLMDPVGIYLA